MTPPAPVPPSQSTSPTSEPALPSGQSPRPATCQLPVTVASPHPQISTPPTNARDTDAPTAAPKPGAQATSQTAHSSTQSSDPQQSPKTPTRKLFTSASANESSAVATTPTMTPESARPAGSPAARTPGPSFGASDLYRTRLRAFLKDAHETVESLLRLRESVTPPPASNMGAPGELAYYLQGHSPHHVSKIFAKLSTQYTIAEYEQILATEAAGKFVDYGVPEGEVKWLISLLRNCCEAEDTIPEEGAAEWARLRVFDAEVAFLPLRCVDGLLAARKLMRKMQTRLDICTRILLAMNGRGRRVAQAALDKLKASLEKAELQTANEQKKLRKLQEKERKQMEKEVAKQKRLKQESARLERAKQERETKQEVTPANGALPSPSVANSNSMNSARRAALEGKRRREQLQRNKQASFMMRFVGKSSGSEARSAQENARGMGETPASKGVTEAECETPKRDLNASMFRKEGVFAADFAEDRDVMTVSWWVRTQMESLSFKDMDVKFAKAPRADGIANGAMMRVYLSECAKRRAAAEVAVRTVMRDFRRGRKERVGDRNPRFVRRRSDCRCRFDGLSVKIYQFDENQRPAYYGTRDMRSSKVNGRKPFVKDDAIDYEYDSEDDWDDDEGGEDLSDIEVDKERVTEDEELAKLYGSDEEDDDDFLDDGALGDDDDENDDDDDKDGEESSGNTAKLMAGESTAGQEQPVDGNKGDVVKVSGTSTASKAKGCETVILGKDVCNSNGKRVFKMDASMSKRGYKRRKTETRQNVVIEGPCGMLEGNASALDRFEVTLIGGKPIPMFNPYVLSMADVTAEHLTTKSSSVQKAGNARTERMDGAAKRELALTVAKSCKVGLTRDKLVSEFCQLRQSNGLGIPTKSEIVRTLGEMATFGKRQGDTRACWFLNDGVLNLNSEGC